MFKKFSNKIYIENQDGTLRRIFPYRGLKGLRIKFSGENSTVILKEPIGKFKHSRINCGSNCLIKLGASVNMKNSEIFANADNNTCLIGDRCTFNKNSMLLLHTEPNLKISFGEDCMVASNVIIRTSDAHAIRDIHSNKITNYGKDINIGNHCWIAMDATVLKGVTIADNVVIGSRSVVTKDCLTPNSIYAGSPAQLIKENVNWQRENPYLASQMDLK